MSVKERDVGKGGYLLLNGLLCSNQQAEPPRMGEEEWDKDCKCSEYVTTTPPLLLPFGHKERIHRSVICQTLP